MATLNDYLKKYPKPSAASSSASLDDYLKKYPKAPDYQLPEPVVNQPVVPVKKPSLINRAFSKTSNFIAGAAEEPEYTNNSWSQTFRNLPNEIVRTILPGAAALHDNPDLAAQITYKDLAKELPGATVKTAFDVFVNSLASFATTFYGATNKVLDKVGLDVVGSKDGEVSFDIPGVGKVTNMQARIADEVAHTGVPTTKLGTAVFVAKYTGFELLNGLYTASIISKVVNPRLINIAKINNEQIAQFSRGNKLGEAPDLGPRSFQFYQPPTITSPTYTKLHPDFVEKLKNSGVDMSKYHPDVPTYFQFTINNKGLISGKVIAVKPSFVNQFFSQFKGDISKVPSTAINVLHTKEVSISQLEAPQAKTPTGVVPPGSAVMPPTPKIPLEEIQYKVEQILPAIKNSPVPDEHLIETAKTLAKESGDPGLVKQVEEAIKTGQENIKQSEEQTKALEEYTEAAQPTPEKQLTNPVSEPYRPARAVPVDRVYANTPTSKFITGTFEGKPYTTDTFIMEFNSDVKPPKKAEIFADKDKVPTEESIKKQIIPNQEEAVSVKPIKVQTTEDGKSSFVQLEKDGITVDINQKYFDYFSKKYPNAVFMAVAPDKPVVVMSKGNMVGLVMPMNLQDIKKLTTTWAKPTPAQPKLKNPPDTTGAKKTVAKKTPEKKPEESKSIEVKKDKTPSGTAQAVYKPEDLPELSKEFGGINKISPIEMPELVRLTRDLMGNFPVIVKKTGNAAGRFYGEGEGRIKLIASLFDAKANKSSQAARVLAHEIGHLIDYLPDHNLKRGNLLGRLQTLQKFMQSTFESVNGEVKNIDVRNELLAVTKYWHPYDPAKVSDSYKKYRESAVELYAEGISVLFNDPAKLQQMAPIFYREFFNGLDNKPEAKRSYFELQELLSGNKEKIIEARMKDIEEGFSRAEALQKDFEAKKKLKLGSMWERLRQQLDDANYPLIKKQNAAEANGVVLPESENPRFLLEELSMADNDNFLFAQDIHNGIVMPLEKAGVTMDDIGKYLMLNRIMTGRSEIANPFGFNPENAKELLTTIKKDIGADNYDLLEKKMQDFHELVYDETVEAVKVGSYNAETHAKTVEPNKDTYAAFRVVDYMQDYMPATIKAQVGTLKEIENPFITTILKTISLKRLNALQRAKNGSIAFMKKTPGDITPSKFKTTDGIIRVFINQPDMGRLEVLENGKIQSYDVDPYIAEMFDKSKVGDLNAIVSILEMTNNKLFKPLYTTFNPGFAFGFNPIRDFSRNFKNIPSGKGFFRDEFHLVDLLTAYIKSLPQARLYASGELDAFTRSLVESKAIEAPINDYNFDPRDDQLGSILQQYGMQPTETSKIPQILIKPIIKLLEGMRYVANTFEIVSKIAGAKVRTERGESGKELAHNLRNFTGTPNWRKKGTQTKTTNAVFMFSNIFKEGYKTDLQIATNPKTRSGYWIKTIKRSLLPKFLMFLASTGILGEKLKEFYDNQSEYDKSNYLVIPLGVTDDKKSIALRIPDDESGRLLSAVLWKMLNAAYKGKADNLQDILSFGAGQLPSLSPAINITSVWTQYLSGKNPYDDFRSKNIIDDTTWTAGGGAAFKKMVYWTINQSGQVNLATYDTSRENGIETAVRLTPIINRFIRITDYGQKEKAQEITEDVRQQRARDVLKEGEVISKHVEDANKNGTKITGTERAEIVREIIGHNPKTEDERARETRIKQKIDVRTLRGSNIKLETIINAHTNDEKVVLLKAYKEEMSENDFAELKRQAYKEGIVTNELLQEVNH